MSWTDYDIVGSYNNQRVSTIDAERSINLFEYIDPKGKKKKSLLPTAGLVNSGLSFGTINNGFRAQFVFKDKMYAVIGNQVVQITGRPGALQYLPLTNPSSSPPLVLGSSTGYVGIDANTYQIIIVDGVKGWIYDTIAQTFKQITDSGFPSTPIDVCYLDGYFVVATGGTNNFQLSQFNQGMVWSGTTQAVTVPTTIANKLTLPAGIANFQVGVDVQFTSSAKTSSTFTASTATNLLTVGSTADYPTGRAVSVKPGTAGVLPGPLSANVVYWVNQVSGTTLQLFLTKADAVANINPVVLTNNGTAPNNIISTTGLPTGIDASTTYYITNVVGTPTNTIQLSSTLALAQAGTADITITNGTGSGTVNILNNGELQLASITSHPGNLVACRTLHRRLFLFSQNFTEVWENAGQNIFGGSNIPFRRNNSLLMEYGTPAVGSIQVGFDEMFFLSQDKDGLGAVMKVSGTQAMPVSTNTLDYQLAQYASTPITVLPPGSPAGTTGISDARGILIKENGIIFYRLNFTINNHTFVYNDTMSNPAMDSERRWHEEEILNGDRHPAQTHAYYLGVNFYGHYSSPIMYQVDPSISTNDGQPIRRARIGRPFCPETYQRIRVDRWHLDILQGSIEEVDTGALDIDLLAETGDTLQTEYGVNLLLESSTNVNQNDETHPIIYLSYSKDGGQSFGNQLPAPMGPIGQRTFRTVWRKLGTVPRGQSFTPYIQFFNKVPFVILGAAWVFEVLPQ